MGALTGYVTNGITLGRVGRRAARCIFTVSEAVIMDIFLAVASNSAVMYLMAILLGFFTRYRASIVTEELPPRMGTTVADVTYNLARFIGPVLITSVAVAAIWTTALALPVEDALLAGILV